MRPCFAVQSNSFLFFNVSIVKADCGVGFDAVDDDDIMLIIVLSYIVRANGDIRTVCPTCVRK